MVNQLDDWRTEIDDIDHSIMEMLRKRFEITKKCYFVFTNLFIIMTIIITIMTFIVNIINSNRRRFYITNSTLLVVLVDQRDLLVVPGGEYGLHEVGQRSRFEYEFGVRHATRQRDPVCMCTSM